jgi:hypothetical protein
MSDKQQGQNGAADMAAMMEEDEAQRKTMLLRRKVPAKRDLKNALLAMTKQDLDDIRYNLNVTGASSLKKAELVEVLVPAILAFAKQWLPSLIEDQYEAFQYLLKHDGLTCDFRDNDVRLDYLRGIGLVMAGGQDGKLAWYMPEEVQVEFRKIDTPALKEMVSVNTEIVRLVTGLLFYYGYLDFDQLFQQLNKYVEKENQLSFADFVAVMLNAACWQPAIEALPHGMHHYTLIDPDWLENEQLQHSNLDFAELTYSEVYDAGEENYIAATPAYKALAQFLMKKFHFDVMKAADVVGEITIILQNSGKMSEAVDYMKGMGLFNKRKHAEKLTCLLLRFSSTTRLWSLKGHQQSEFV